MTTALEDLKQISDSVSVLETLFGRVNEQTWPEIIKDVSDPIDRAELAFTFAFAVSGLRFIQKRLEDEPVDQVMADIGNVRQYAAKIKATKEKKIVVAPAVPGSGSGGGGGSAELASPEQRAPKRPKHR
eukprot:ANDGO_07971.mRNA.1 hypothetical protein